MTAWRAPPGSGPRFSFLRERVIRIPIAGRYEWQSVLPPETHDSPASPKRPVLAADPAETTAAS